MTTSWKIKGELVLNCSCTVFCPCVISLGKHPPTEGFCQGWWGLHIEHGYFGDTKLDGLNTGLLLDIPHSMGRGGWTTATYIDERADDAQFDALARIHAGQAGGSTGLLSLLVSNHLGAQRKPITYKTEGKSKNFQIPGVIDGIIEPIPGGDRNGETVITNSAYWIAPEIVVSQARRSKLKAFGRVWDFEGRSAEFCRIEWSGP